MTVRTPLLQALERVADEREHVTEKQNAFDEFERTVRDLSVAPQSGEFEASQAPTGGSIAVSVATTHGTRPSEDHCRSIREAFTETVRPYSVEDLDEPESLVETMAEELSRDLATMLAPGSGGQFTAPTKRALLSAVAERQQELTVMKRALDAEEQSLRSASDEIGEIIDRLAEANESRMINLGFDALQTHHEELTRHRDRCDEIVHDRQDFLHDTTSRDATVGLTHRSLVEYLYAELSIDHPVLVTVTRLDDICADRQREVRDQIVRRV
jgi:hypothetical protein